ncbi:MAG TPA: hypothetical protein VK633_04915 [Verrucomicrobiae bacterium]|nr:hypothetical protein [Verrucomicrobiae bacterium]
MNFPKIAIFALCLSLRCGAQVPSAEQLLPDDVIGVVTVPDWKKLMGGYHQSAWGQLWADPAMKPFRENFSSNFQADFLRPLEKELGLKLADYQELLQGQVTLALTPPKAGSKQFLSFILLVDSRDKSEQLTSRLAEIKKKWSEAGRDVKAEKIREVEFQSISFSSADVRALLKKAFPGGEEEDDGEAKAPAEKIQLRIGQFKSLLVIGEDEKAIEKVLARQSGGLVPPLGDKAAYQKTHALLFRDSAAHAWLNFKPIYQKILEFSAAEKQEPVPGMPAMKIDKILPALGFAALESLAAKINSGSEGSAFDFFIGVPEGAREGLFKIFTLEKKDASPPPFVPADVLKFQRTRLDGQKAWTTLESMLGKIEPSLAGLIQLMLSSAGKEQDPNFDLKKNLISNLGDDIIQYQKPPKAANATELQNPLSLLLIGSPNPTQLVDAIRLLTSLLPPPLSSAPLKEREFLGKKIYSLSLAPQPSAAVEGDEKAPATPQAMLSFSASAGYVAFSSDNSVLEEFLRSGENPPKPLRAVAGLNEAAQKIGGMENGLFTYENQAESLRLTMEALKNDPEGFNKMLFFSLSKGDEEGQGAFKKLVDLKLLPGFDRISKYFGLALVSGATTADGYLIRAFGPTPAAIKK